MPMIAWYNLPTDFPSISAATFISTICMHDIIWRARLGNNTRPQIFQAFQWVCSHSSYSLLHTCMIAIILSLAWSATYSNTHNVAHNGIQMDYVLVTLSVVHKWYPWGWRPRDQYHLCTCAHLRVVSTSKYLLLSRQLRKIYHTG